MIYQILLAVDYSDDDGITNWIIITTNPINKSNKTITRQHLLGLNA